MHTLFENITLNQDAFDLEDISMIEASDCIIENCNFSDKTLSNCIFNNCTLSNCNLSLSKFKDTQLNNIRFEKSKVLGVDFSQCVGFLFEIHFYDCILDFCSFENIKMIGTVFSRTSMKGVDFSGTNLQKSVFKEVNLQDAIFSRTNLKESNLSTASNFRISPNQNYIKKAIFAENNLSGLLLEFDIKFI